MNVPTTETAKALRIRPMLVSWLLAIGVDFFFNAGLFSDLFDQNREPSLLPDAVLFRRIPVAYLGLALGVVALGWLFDRIDLRGLWRGAGLGGLAGLVFAILGVVGLWTALEMTGLFVAAAGLVQVAEFGVAGGFLGAYRDSRFERLIPVALGVTVLLAIAGVIIQNLKSL